MSVPKDESEAPGRGGEGTRKGKAKAKGAKGKGKGKRDTGGSRRPPVPAVVDPSYAVLVKYKERGQIVAIGHRRLIGPSDFARESGLDLGLVSRHFQALKKAGFLELAGTIRVRGATKHLYRSTKRALFTTIDWGKLGEAVQEEMAPGVVHDLNTAFNEAMDTGTFYRHDDVILFWLALMLDKVSWPEFVKILAWGVEEVKELADDTVNRHANGETDGCFPAAFAIAGFELPTESERKKASGRRKSKGAKQKPAKRKPAKPSKGKPAKGKGKGRGRKK